MSAVTSWPLRRPWARYGITVEKTCSSKHLGQVHGNGRTLSLVTIASGAAAASGVMNVHHVDCRVIGIVGLPINEPRFDVQRAAGPRPAPRVASSPRYGDARRRPSLA